jgi:hypothetical protein
MTEDHPQMVRTTASFVLALCLWGSATASDVLLKNVMIYDSTGEAGYLSDVRIHNDRIAQVGVLLQALSALRHTSGSNLGTIMTQPTMPSALITAATTNASS